jgi:hypothetical protein
MRKLALGSACASAHTWQKNFLASSVVWPCAAQKTAVRTDDVCEQNRGAGVRPCSVVAQCCPRDAGGASRRWQR